MLTYVEEISLFESPSQALVNTVNTVGVMGKGIAADFKRAYPTMFEEYRRICKSGKLDVGMLYIYRTLNKIIVNFPTKRHWKQPSKLEYIEKGLKKFVNRYTDFGISSVSFPQLGCGHGELNWEEEVKPIMERYLKNLPIPVYIHLYPKPSDFIPERLDKEYANEVIMQERQRISTAKLWNDLHKVIFEKSSRPISLDLFGQKIDIDEENITFKSELGELKVYKEDIEDIWGILRIRGTISERDFPKRIVDERITQWLFELLKQIEYIKPAKLQSKEGPTFLGLRYEPPPENKPLAEHEIII